MDHRQVARILAVGRVLVGAALTLAPGIAGKLWVGDSAASPATRLAFRAMGIRDLALGAGTLHALSTGEPARPWVLLGGVSDGVDVLATGIAIRQIPRTAAIPSILVAGTAAVVSAMTVDHLD